jgi:SAM-dependent methyltransferase
MARPMEELPWPDDTFDVVTGFNSFQFAADPVNALREAKRVTAPGGRVAMVVWGRDEDCDTMVTVAAVVKLLPLSPPGAAAPAPLSSQGRVEALFDQAGLKLLTSDEVDCLFEFPDLETAVRGMMSAGVMVAAAQRAGVEMVQRAVADSLAPFQTSAGAYRQRNRFRYVIASA